MAPAQRTELGYMIGEWGSSQKEVIDYNEAETREDFAYVKACASLLLFFLKRGGLTSIKITTIRLPTNGL